MWYNTSKKELQTSIRDEFEQTPSLRSQIDSCGLELKQKRVVEVTPNSPSDASKISAVSLSRDVIGRCQSIRVSASDFAKFRGNLAQLQTCQIQSNAPALDDTQPVKLPELSGSLPSTAKKSLKESLAQRPFRLHVNRSQSVTPLRPIVDEAKEKRGPKLRSHSASSSEWSAATVNLKTVYGRTKPASMGSAGTIDDDICAVALSIERFASEFATGSYCLAPPTDWHVKLSTFVETIRFPCISRCSAEMFQKAPGTSEPTELSTKQELLEHANHWVAQSIELLKDFGILRRSSDMLGHLVEVDSSPAAPPVACYRHWTRTITFGWSGVPWHINVVKLVAAHETWHAVQHMLWGQHHNSCPAIRHHAFEGGAVLFMAVCVGCEGWRDTLPTFVDYIIGKSAQTVAAAHTCSGAWTAEDARAYEVKHTGCCPLGGLQGVVGTLAYLQSTAVLAHDLKRLQLSPQERLLALLIAPLNEEHRDCNLSLKIRGSVRWLRNSRKTAAVQQLMWPTDEAAPTAEILGQLERIFVVDRKSWK